MVRLDVGDAGELLTLQRGAYAQQAQVHHDPWLPPLTQPLEDLRRELALPTTLALGMADTAQDHDAARRRTSKITMRSTPAQPRHFPTP